MIYLGSDVLYIIRVPELTLSPAGCVVFNVFIQNLSSFLNSCSGCGLSFIMSIGCTTKSLREWSLKLKCWDI